MEEGTSRNKHIQGRSRDKQELRPGLLPPPRTQAPRPEGRYLSEMLWGPGDRGWGSLPEMLLQGMECALRAARPTGNHLWYISLIRRSRLRPCQFMKGHNSGPGRRRDLFKITWLICISSGGGAKSMTPSLMLFSILASPLSIFHRATRMALLKCISLCVPSLLETLAEFSPPVPFAS